MPPDPIASLTADVSGLMVDAFDMRQEYAQFSLYAIKSGFQLRVSIASGESNFGVSLNLSAVDAMRLGRMLYTHGKQQQTNDAAAGTAGAGGR